MIVYKTKRFSREDHWIPNPQPFEAPKEYIEGQELVFIVQTNSNYEKKNILNIKN